LYSPCRIRCGCSRCRRAHDNIANNLPVGLVAGSVPASDHLPVRIVSAMLIGVDLGPNLSVTGSLATILWLVAPRREKIEVTAWRFLTIGALVADRSAPRSAPSDQSNLSITTTETIC